MKILSNKEYKYLLNQIEHKDNQIEHKDKSIVDLREKLINAENLKEVLVTLAEKTGIPNPKKDKGYLFASTGTYGSSYDWKDISLNENVLVYVDDILGGKVIKQEGIKCLVIDKDGNVKTGLTKQKADKGFSYKLIREA